MVSSMSHTQASCRQVSAASRVLSSTFPVRATTAFISPSFQAKGGEEFSRRAGLQKKLKVMDISLRQKGAFNLETAGWRGCRSVSGIDLLAVILFAVSAGRRACLQAVCMKALAHSHGALAHVRAYSHQALADIGPCLQARAVLFASRYR
jgi:hypothetical protein